MTASKPTTLADHHRTMLESESGIHPNLIKARGYRTVTDAAELKRLVFSAKQLNVPALLIPIFSPTGEVKLYQSRPDTPRLNDKGKPVKYETPAGSHMSLDVHPSAKGKLADPQTPLWITEGIKKGDALVTHGLCAVALIGVWNWRGTNDRGGKTALPEWEFIALNDRPVYIAFDSDVMSKKEVAAALVRLKGMLEHKGAKVKLVYLPDAEDGAKQGVDDYLAAGHSVDDLRALATSELSKPKPEGDKGHGPYRVENGVICHKKPSRDGPVTVPLCNFSARITEERERDDGVEKTLNLVLTGKMATGQPLPEAEVTASQFASLNWVVSEWGSRAVVYAGQGAKDHLRAALQILSGDVPRRTTYTHLGWREIDGRMVYLHAGGVLGAPVAPNAPITTQVEPPQGLDSFVLPEPLRGDELSEAVRASLETLDLAPDLVTVPLFGATYRAVLGGVDSGIHLAGQTGNGKSELAAIYQQHFGPGLDARNLPGSWSSTANALEGLAFAGKDVLVTVDDFAPEGSSYDIQRYHATAARLFRAQGNNAARGRMRADGTLRPNKPPRGMILSTGEDIPKGHSIKARTLILELDPGALDWQRLTKAQARASEGVYAAAMSGFIVWLAENYQGRIDTFKADHERFRAELQSSGHKRTVDAGAQLLATYRTLLTFALEVGALSEPEHMAYWHRVKSGIQAALEPQAALQAQSDPVARFSELLSGLLVSGRAHVADAGTGRYPGEGWGWGEVSTSLGREFRPEGARIGWVDDSGLYLEPSVTYAALQSFARDQGDSVPVTERTLWKRLAEREVVKPAEDGHTTIKRTFTGAGRVRVLYIPTPTLSIIGAIGAAGAEPVRDGETTRPEAGQQKTPSGQSGQQKARAEQHPDSAPKINGAAKLNGARETPSGTAHAPNAPIAPINTGVETPAEEKETDTPKWRMRL